MGVRQANMWDVQQYTNQTLKCKTLVQYANVVSTKYTLERHLSGGERVYQSTAAGYGEWMLLSRCRGSPHTSQISQWLLYPSLWLRISGLNSHFRHCFLYKLLSAVSLKMATRFCRLQGNTGMVVHRSWVHPVSTRASAIQHGIYKLVVGHALGKLWKNEVHSGAFWALFHSFFEKMGRFSSVSQHDGSAKWWLFLEMM